jgi:hypothetical protein
VEGLHTVGDIFIKDKCQLCVKLCVALLFMHLFLWVFPVYVACVFLLLFLCMNLCICRVFVCFNFVYSSKFLMWHSPVGWLGMLHPISAAEFTRN